MLNRFRPPIVTLIIILFTSVLIFLINTSTVAQTVSPGAADEVGGHPVWDDVVVSILGAPEDAPDLSKLALPAGHLGWDKETQRPLPDPAFRRGYGIASDALDQAKLDTINQTELRYRSGFTQSVNNGLDANWLNNVANSDAPLYGVIQFVLPFDTAARIELEQLGVKFYNYVEGGGLYARVPDTAVAKLQSLADAKRILYAGAIPIAARIEAKLSTQAQTSPNAAVAVTLQLFDIPDQAQLDQIAPFLNIYGQSLHPALPLLDGTILAKDALNLASLPFVRWVEIDLPAKPNNLESTMALGTDILRDSNPNSDGSSIVVGVIDSGIANPYHADLPVARINDQWEYYPSDDAIANDTVGHGTHVAGTIGGDAAGRLQGHAPDVDFLIYKLCCNASGNGYTNTDFQNALTRGANNNMHISNNSWGDTGYNAYNTSAEIVDRAVRGEYGNQYINMVISAGNDNELVPSPGTAKNGITVGALKDGNWPDQTSNFNGCNDNIWPPGTRVCFSNHGPIDIDGDDNERVKPDVMTPGVWIRSAQPGNTYADYWGTSMAAPGVTGAIAAVLDHHDDSNSWLFDWPEAVKALTLVNAVDIGGNTDMYGRGLLSSLDMSYTVTGITGSGTFSGNTIPTTGDTIEKTFNVPTGYDQVKVVLTWPDPAGSAEVANDLDLRVYSNSTCSGTAVGFSTSYDDTVEFVTVSSGAPSGTWCAEVRGHSISTANQSFGLATRSIIQPASLSVTSSVEDASVRPNEFFYYYTTAYNSGFTAGGAYIRIILPTGFTLDGARIYTDDGRSHYYNDSDIRDLGDGTWRVAVGSITNLGPRLVRWFVRADNDVSPGSYNFYADAYFQDSGSLGSSGFSTTVVNVPAAVAPWLTISQGAGTSVDLNWSTHSNNCNYRVHEDWDPYFSVAWWTEIAGPFSGGYYNQPGATGEPALNYFYVIRADNCGTDTADSNRVGEFDFAIEAGQ